MCSICPEKWVVLQIDRYHDKMGYGMGPELRYLYDGTVFRDIILNDKNTCTDNGNLIVNNNSVQIVLTGEPDHEWFDETIHSKWKKWNEIVGKFDDDWMDYEPWSYNSREIIADELGIKTLKDNCKDNCKNKFYNKV
jgi:hypothetical protein